MALKGFIDRAAGRERLKQMLLARNGPDFKPLDGWDAFHGPDDPICDIKCQQCRRWVPEVRPFGKDGMSICEECAAKDMETTTERQRAMGIR